MARQVVDQAAIGAANSYGAMQRKVKVKETVPSGNVAEEACRYIDRSIDKIDELGFVTIAQSKYCRIPNSNSK